MEKKRSKQTRGKEGKSDSNNEIVGGREGTRRTTAVIDSIRNLDPSPCLLNKNSTLIQSEDPGAISRV